MEVTTRFTGRTRFEVEARGHRAICDQPPENGGDDEGMTPPEFLLASLATCAGYYAVQYLKVHQLPAEDLTVKVSAEKAQQPARLGSFEIEVTAPGVEARHEAGILRAVHKCLIHNTLMQPPQIAIRVAMPVLACTV